MIDNYSQVLDIVDFLCYLWAVCARGKYCMQGAREGKETRVWPGIVEKTLTLLKTVNYENWEINKIKSIYHSRKRILNNNTLQEKWMNWENPTVMI